MSSVGSQKLFLWMHLYLYSKSITPPLLPYTKADKMFSQIEIITYSTMKIYSQYVIQPE